MMQINTVIVGRVSAHIILPLNARPEGEPVDLHQVHLINPVRYGCIRVSCLGKIRTVWP